MLPPTRYGICITDPNDATVEEEVSVEPEVGGKDWVARVRSARSGHVAGVGESPELAIQHLARTLRVIADRIDPIAADVTAMVKGLCRAAEFREQEDGGRVQDDEIRRALETAKRLGWTRNRYGTLRSEALVYEELPDGRMVAELGTDAAKWASAFMVLVAKGVTIDEGMMIGWFANAIEEAKRRARHEA